MKYILPAAILLVALAFSTASHATDQKATTESRELFELIARMDSAMFEALNAHDDEKLMSMFTDDLEFYQDNDGLKNYQESLGDFRKMFASAPDIRRELVKDSLEVYPIKDTARSRLEHTDSAIRRMARMTAVRLSLSWSGGTPAIRGRFHA